MAIVGLVGGLGPESTIDYYRRILEAWQKQDAASAPRIIIDSLDVQQGIRLAQSDHAGLTDYLTDSVLRLARAGADFAAMSANTAHLVFDQVAHRSPIPLISIVEVCADEAARLGLQQPLLLGSGFTMRASFFPDVFRRRGIDVVTASELDRNWVHERYIGELLKGDFRDDTRSGFVDLVRRMKRDAGIDGVILGGTELPLLLRDTTIADLPALDTTALHVAAIVERLRAQPAVRASAPTGMFERYNEGARRALFFARYEVSQVGGMTIDVGHLFLGVSREHPDAIARLSGIDPVQLQQIRTEAKELLASGERLATAHEIPFSAGVKQALQFAAEEADALLHPHIGQEHLLLGILRQQHTDGTDWLARRGIGLNVVRERARDWNPGESSVEGAL